MEYSPHKSQQSQSLLTFYDSMRHSFVWFGPVKFIAAKIMVWQLVISFRFVFSFDTFLSHWSQSKYNVYSIGNVIVWSEICKWYLFRAYKINDGKSPYPRIDSFAFLSPVAKTEPNKQWTSSKNCDFIINSRNGILLSDNHCVAWAQNINNMQIIMDFNL